jgi:hypothetical protein
MGYMRATRLLTFSKEMKHTRLILLVLTFLGTSGAVLAKPSNVKESEFLLGCRPPCERDASQLNFSSTEAKRRCDCYCRVIFQNMNDKDFNYFKQYQTYSPYTLKAVESALHRCIFTGK